jgi:hypothetical protein
LTAQRKVAGPFKEDSAQSRAHSHQSLLGEGIGNDAKDGQVHAAADVVADSSGDEGAGGVKDYAYR